MTTTDPIRPPQDPGAALPAPRDVQPSASARDSPCSAGPSTAGELSDADAASFLTVRPRLFGIAYRVLGSPTEADDVVQDTWIRWQRTDRSKVRDTATFLATTTTRLAINVIQSARARRETCLGPQLADRVTTRADPRLDPEQGEALELAVRMLLEKLSGTERAVYILREAFDYPHRQIAEILGLGEANARQICTRARRRLAAENLRPVGRTEQQRLLSAFLAAAQTGDLATLEQLLAADAAGRGSGAEVVQAA